MSFFECWRNLIDLTNKLSEDCFLDKYYIRTFFIHLYELIVSGIEYSQYAQTWNSQDVRYKKFDEFINAILGNISEDEFFMITYYRNCGCHIFLTHYSWLKSYASDQVRLDEKKRKFKRKNGSIYYLSKEEIKDVAKRVIGKFGTEQDLFKRGLFYRLSPIILNEKYSI